MVQSTIPSQRHRFSRNKENVRLKSSSTRKSSVSNENFRFNSTRSKMFPQIHIDDKYLKVDEKCSFVLNDEFNRSCSSLNDEKKIFLSFDEQKSSSKEKISRRTSITTTSEENNSHCRPPSSPVERRCQRLSSSISSNLNRETCQLLGPDLCSDCLEIRLKDQFDVDQHCFHCQSIEEHLFHLSRQTHLPSRKTSFDHQQRLKTNSNRKQIFEFDDEILTDEEYFDDLASNLRKKRSKENDFYFRDFKDLTSKYRSNVYPRLLISETPVPHSSNEVFQSIRSDLFLPSKIYSQMKFSSKETFSFHSKAPTFISPRKSQQFISEHRFLQNYSPPLLIQRSNQSKTTSNNSQRTFSSVKHSLINTKNHSK